MIKRILAIAVIFSVTRQELNVRPQPGAWDSSSLRADLHVDYREKGLLWRSTYQVAFQGEHSFHNPMSSEQTFEFQLLLPAQKAVYDGLALCLYGKQMTGKIHWDEKFARREQGAVRSARKASASSVHL